MKRLICLYLCLSMLAAGSAVAATIEVYNVDQLLSELGSANYGDIILLHDGTYQVPGAGAIEIGVAGVTVGSYSGNRNSVIINGLGMSSSPINHGFFVSANDVTIQNLTIRDVRNHAIQTDVGIDGLHVNNCVIYDTGEQMIKVPYSADSSANGIVENSVFYYTAGQGPQYYIGGIDVHSGSNWIVRHNIFWDIQSPGGEIAEHAIHFWNNSSGTLVEGNLIINCDRGIGFGLGTSSHSGGIIRNNMIYHDGSEVFPDVGIGLETSSNTQVYNNTIFFTENAYFNAIEYRFSGTYGTYIANNLTSKAIASRNGGTGTVENNVTTAQAGWFVSPSTGDLHLLSAVSSVVDQGIAISGLTDDFDGETRPIGAGIDIGADEYNDCTLTMAVQLAPSGATTRGYPSYSWESVECAAWYRLWAGWQDGFGTWQTAVDQWSQGTSICQGGTCEVVPPVYLPAGEYSWWVQTWNASGYGPWSEGMAFTVTGPTQIAPSGDIDDFTPTYSWEDVSWASYYRVWVGSNASGVWVASHDQWYDTATVCSAGTCSVSPAQALAPGNYSWWVLPWSSSAGYGVWSDGLSFSLGTAAQIAPSGDIDDTTPQYEWGEVEGTTWYQLWVGWNDGANWNTALNEWYQVGPDVSCSEGICVVEPSTPLAFGEYGWWVQTWSASAGLGPWSNGLTFTLGKATQIAPSGTITTNNPTYEWNAVNEAEWYQLWVGWYDTAGWYAAVNQWYQASSECSDTSCSVTPTTTLSSGEYSWWLRTWNSSGFGPWSDGMSFTVDSSGAMQTAPFAIIVRKTGTGTGTLRTVDQECGSGCLALVIPYVEGARITLEVIPESDSIFVGWETADGTQLNELYYAQPGDTIYAVFQRL